MAEIVCTACAASWDGGVARWCGRCGAPLVRTEQATARRSRGSRSWLALGSALAVVTLVALAAADTSFLAASERRASSASVQLPSPTELAELAAAAARRSSQDAADAGPACRPDGCVRWVRPDLDRRPTMHEGGLLVHVGAEVVTALDARTGSTQWARPLADPRMARPRPTPTVAVVDRGMVFLGYGGQLVRHNLYTGDEVPTAVDLAPYQLAGAARTDAGALLVGFTSAPLPAWIMAGVGGDGTIAWQVDGLATAPLIVDAPQGRVVLDDRHGDARDQLAAYDASSGEVLWARPMGSLRVERADPLHLVDYRGGIVDAVDPWTGESRFIVGHGPPIDNVWYLGPWIGIVAGDAVHVHDLGDGREVLVRRNNELRRSSGIAWGDGAVVAWASRHQERGIEVVHYDGQGRVQDRIWTGAVPIDWCCPMLTRLAGDNVRLSVGRGRYMAWLDIGTGEIRGEREHTPLEPRTAVRELGGIVSLQELVDRQTITFYGELDTQPVTVAGPASIVTLDPPIVHAPVGLLALEPPQPAAPAS